MSAAQPRSVYIHTWGCQMNEYDSARLYDLLRESCGLQRCEGPEGADLVLLNTCSVREKPQEKLFSELGRLQRLRSKANRGMLIGVGGCVAAQEGQAIQERAPQVDFVFGPQTLHRVPDLMGDALRRRDGGARSQERIPLVDTSFPKIEKFDALPAPSLDAPSAMLSIMEGCSKYCSFCVVPYTRGEEVCRPAADILREARQLEQAGAAELVLLGQNVNAWREGSRDLAWLLAELERLDGVGRLRFTTSHPLEMTDSLIEAFATNTKLAAHLHLPVQSGSDRVLRAMKRGYTAEEYLDIVARLRRACPQIAMSTDIIVGFPGESERDFADTLRLVEQVGYDRSFSFLYSERPGTPAAALPQSAPRETRAQRLQLLQHRLEQSAQALAQGMVGRVQRCLVSGFSKRDPGSMAARTDNMLTLNFPGIRPDLIGTFVQARVEEAMPNSLRGKLLEASAH